MQFPGNVNPGGAGETKRNAASSRVDSIGCLISELAMRQVTMHEAKTHRTRLG
jgi:hypothetical protein